MKCFYFFILIFVLGSFKAQIRFNSNLPIGTDTVADAGVKVIQLKNKGYLSCGNAAGFMINYTAAYLTKTDSFGNLIWKKQYDFTIAGFDLFTDLVELPDSNYLLSGTTTDPGPDDDDVFLVKIDTGGNVLWKKQYTYPENDQSRALKLTPDGKVIIVGNSFTTGNRDGLLIKTDLDGNLIWRKTITNTVAYDEVYYNIDVIKNNNEYIIGGMKGYYNTGNPFFDLDLIRTDTAGNVLWQQQYGSPTDEDGKGGTYTLDSGYVLCGAYNGEGAILKLDKNGNLQWFKNYSFSNTSIINQVKQLPDSGYAMIVSDADMVSMTTTGFLVRADKNGNMLWKRVYPGVQGQGANYFFGFNTTTDKGFIMTGQYNHIGQPYQNMWLVKTDSLGCDSVTCSYLPTGVSTEAEALESSVFKIYPNPAHDVIELEILTNSVRSNFSIKITNTLGQTINNLNTESKNLKLDISDFSEGIYFVEIYHKGKFIGVKKILKQ